MSEVKVNKISPRTACGTVTLGDSGDTFTIPSGATITNSGTASGFGATGETSWDTTVKTTGTFTATAGVGYFLNTTGGIITVNLPAGSAGDSVAMVDYAGTWDTNGVVVAPDGSEKIGGVAADANLSTERQSVTFVYIDGTQGWVNVLDSTSAVVGNEYIIATGGTPCTGATCGNCKIHTFTGPGTFCVSQVHPCAANNLVSYMVVAGGGGGGAGHPSSGAAGSGAGAGGFREYKSPVTPYTASPLDGNPCGTAITVSASPYTITVGGGGAAAASAAPAPGPSKAVNGSDSVFSTITSTGGGYGGSRSWGSPPGGGSGTNTNCRSDGGSGGSGGGGNIFCAPSPGTPGTAGTGNSPPVTPAQGFNGGVYAPGTNGGVSGGGATAAGATNNPGPSSGVGGAGATSSIDGTPTGRAGGGGAGLSAGGAGGGTACSGGGAGGSTPGGTGTAGTVNTGGGSGGGGDAGDGGLGGSGVVIIRYKFQ